MNCKNCKMELPMHRLGCPEAKGETALYAKVEQLQAERDGLKDVLKYAKKCFSSIGYDGNVKEIEKREQALQAK